MQLSAANTAAFTLCDMFTGMSRQIDGINAANGANLIFKLAPKCSAGDYLHSDIGEGSGAELFTRPFDWDVTWCHWWRSLHRKLRDHRTAMIVY